MTGRTWEGRHASDGDSVAIQSQELDLECLPLTMHVHDDAHVAGAQSIFRQARGENNLVMFFQRSTSCGTAHRAVLHQPSPLGWA